MSSKRRSTFRPRFQTLEDRRCLAASALVAGELAAPQNTDEIAKVDDPSIAAGTATLDGGGVVNDVVNNDGAADIIAGPGPGGGPHVHAESHLPGVGPRSGLAPVEPCSQPDTSVRVFNGNAGAELTSFFAYPANFSGGVRVASGDISGDGLPDIITVHGMHDAAPSFGDRAPHAADHADAFFSDLGRD